MSFFQLKYVFMLFVFRSVWKTCCFSGDGEYICAGSARQHSLYVWERATGHMVKILNGTKGEVLLDVAVRLITSRSAICLSFVLYV